MEDLLPGVSGEGGGCGGLIRCGLGFWWRRSLISDFAQSDLVSGPSLVGDHQVLREIWIFGREFRARDFDRLWVLGGIKFVKLFGRQQNFVRISN